MGCNFWSSVRGSGAKWALLILLALHLLENMWNMLANSRVTGYCYVLVSYKAFHSLRPFYYLLWGPIWVLITTDLSTRARWLQQRHLVAKQGKLCEERPLIFLAKYLCHTPQGYLTYLKILRDGDYGFISPPKKVVLRIFIALRSPSSSAWFEPANIGPSDKHGSHETAENDKVAS
jgi:hypothetical protein